MTSIIKKLLNWLYSNFNTQFTDLPPDMQREILGLDINTLIDTMSLSKETYRIIAPMLSKKLCQLPITSTEMLKYLQDLQGSRELFATMHVNVPNRDNYCPHWEKITLASIYQKNNSNYNQKTYNIYPDHIIVYDQQNTNISYKYAVLYDFKRSNHLPDLDVKSLYEIYRKRLGCVKLDPTYGKDYVHNIFHDFIDRFNNDDDYSKMILYIYLLLNLQTLEIDFSENPRLISGRTYQIDQFIDQITMDIPIMIKLIDQAIDDL